MSLSKTVERVCQQCGKPIPSGKPNDQRFCGTACRNDSFKVPFWDRVDKNGPVPAHRPDLGPCWNWTGYVAPNGYGMTGDGYAHRISFELNVGPIPDGLEPDHLCRNRRCVNDAHMELVTHRVNFLRGEHPNAVIARSGRCKHGHERTAENARVYADGATYCRVCDRERARHRRARKKQEMTGNG